MIRRSQLLRFPLPWTTTRQRLFSSYECYSTRTFTRYITHSTNHSIHESVSTCPSRVSSRLFTHTSLSATQTFRRNFSSSRPGFAISFRDLKGEDAGKEQIKKGQDQRSSKNKTASTQEDLDPAEEAYRQARRETEKEWAKFKDQARQREEQEQKKSNEGDGQDQQKPGNEEPPPPPPPPHDNRTPWQVFTETLTSEFKKSKEWNESTKALSSSAHTFTENESVKRARAAYTAASGAATSGTASALRGAGKSIGHGAAWTWDTNVVRGVRQGVNATGRAIDTATKPVRDTKAFKSVKDVIDDGSSSRYGGWTEKEERRKQRELRDLEDAAASGRPGRRRSEKMEEDPT